jgi:hypothetical protein
MKKRVVILSCKKLGQKRFLASKIELLLKMENSNYTNKLLFFPFVTNKSFQWQKKD